MTDARARLIGINHVALEVGDIDEALTFYGDLFGFELRGRVGADGLPRRGRSVRRCVSRQAAHRKHAARAAAATKQASVAGSRLVIVGPARVAVVLAARRRRSRRAASSAPSTC